MESAFGFRAAILLVAFGLIAYGGYRRRRPVWTRASWRRFALLLCLCLALSALSFRMAFGVDHGVYQGMTPLAHRLYFYTLMVSGLIGDLGTFGLIIWFARGRPSRQLG